MTSLREKITQTLSFGSVVCEGFAYHDCPADGGWINVDIPVFACGRLIGRALLGATVYTDTALAKCDGLPLEAINEIDHYGFTIGRYEGTDRKFILDLAGYRWRDLFGLSDEEAEELEEWERWEIEELILDAASVFDLTNYERLFRNALSARLADTRRDEIGALIRAVRELCENGR